MSATRGLITALTNAAPNVRKAAAIALGSIGSKEAVTALFEAFRKEQDFHAAEAYIRALGQTGSPEVVEPLLACFSSVFYVHEAAEAFANVSAQNLALMLPKLIAHQNTVVRRKSVEIIGYYTEDVEVLQQISDLAKDDHDPQVRTAANAAKEKLIRKLDLLHYTVLDGSPQPLIDNDSKDQVLIGDMYKIVGEAGFLFRQKIERDKGIDGEIEFKDAMGKATGKMVYVQLKSGDSHLYHRKSDNKEIYYITNPDHPKYWHSHNYEVLLVVRNSDGTVRFMNLTDYLNLHGTDITQVVFDGQGFTATSLRAMASRVLRAAH